MKTKTMWQRVEELTQLFGVSGYERAVRSYLRGEISGDADEITTDALGNLIALKKGTDPVNGKKMMFSAHMDEIGFQVIKINDDGSIMVRSMGFTWIYINYMSRVRFQNGVCGIISGKVLPEKFENKMINLFVDIGAVTKGEAAKFVQVGDVAVYEGSYQELVGETITAKALDDRIGCAILVEAMKKIQSSPNDLYFVFSVQEELGCRGGKTAAERIQPDIGVAVDVTPAHDRPSDLEGSNTVGGGVGIKVADPSVICDANLVSTMKECCLRETIKYQPEVIYQGGTDAGAISLSHWGVRCAGISVVTRYPHGPNAVVSKEDSEGAAALLCSFADQIFNFNED